MPKATHCKLNTYVRRKVLSEATQGPCNKLAQSMSDALRPSDSVEKGEAIHQPAIAPAFAAARKDLLEAKELGLGDQLVADYAGLTLEEFIEYQRRDPSLERELRQARAKGLADNIRGILAVTQWQARQFVLTTFWANVVAPPDGTTPNDSPMIRAFRHVARRMTPDQVARAAEVMETGRLEDSKQKAEPATPENV